jgi:hypothetical protein
MSLSPKTQKLIVSVLSAGGVAVMAMTQSGIMRWQTLAVGFCLACLGAVLKRAPGDVSFAELEKLLGENSQLRDELIRAREALKKTESEPTTRYSTMLALCFAAVFSLQLVACKVPPVEWPDVAKCGSGVSDHVGDVGQILLADGPDSPLSEANKSKLAKLGLDIGLDVVPCIVGRWIDRWSSPGAARPPAVVAAERRAREWLEYDARTTVLTPPGGW